ncbi:MAG: hypothetical protein KDA24_29330 [Deltaproteobacteria bacterium]|nr:hypothetical protein [Deltaproteobacteria bacterium]
MVRRAALIAFALSLVACPSGEPEPSQEPPTAPALDLGEPISVKSDLRMKRWRQLHLDLQGALELAPDDICNETGLYDCRVLHTVPLGGISIDNALFRPIDAPSATTGLAVERFVLQACAARAFEDTAPGADPVIFDLEADGTTLSREAADPIITALYRRFLARDPLSEESDALYAMHADLVADGGLNLEWGWLACFAVATSTEALLY